MEKLSCGHDAPPVPETGASGYAIRPDGAHICYPCADAEQRAALLTANTYMGYLSGDGSQITTWTGGTLATVTTATERRVGFGAWRKGEGRTYWKAVDVHGQRWHGTSPGRGMFARMRKSKTR